MIDRTSAHQRTYAIGAAGGGKTDIFNRYQSVCSIPPVHGVPNDIGGCVDTCDDILASAACKNNGIGARAAIQRIIPPVAANRIVTGSSDRIFDIDIAPVSIVIAHDHDVVRQSARGAEMARTQINYGGRRITGQIQRIVAARVPDGEDPPVTGARQRIGGAAGI